MRVTDDAQMRLSMLKRFVELAHCDMQNLHEWEKRYTEFDQLCNSKSNSAAMRSLLRCEHEVGVAGV